MPRPHLPAPKQLSFRHSLHHERHLMEQVDVPIVTVSSTFLEAFPRSEIRHHSQEIVLSRAHYSQAIACLIAAVRLSRTTWLVDPTNYVSAADWPKLLLTEKVAETLVRHDFLLQVRRLIENRARDKLPISGAIDDPLLYVTDRVTHPILSLHYETANLLVPTHKVLSVVTDPYIRPQYLIHAANPNLHFAVFDQATKKELISKTSADLTSKIYVTGPPVDPRIVDCRRSKRPTTLTTRPLRLGLTTGGTGTNKPEIEAILDSLAPRLTGRTTTLQLLCYAGTHPDFKTMFINFARRHHLTIRPASDTAAEFRLIHADHLMAANELLIDHLFPWADIVITKPSGDIAYEAAAAGAGLLFLNPLGPWEKAIQARFEKLQIGADIPNPHHFADQLIKLEQAQWPAAAQTHALKLPSLYLNGASKIVKTLLKL